MISCEARGTRLPRHPTNAEVPCKGMEIELNKLTKVSYGASGRTALDPDEVVEAILKLKTAGYVPTGVDVRARLDATMITGTFPARVLEQIEADPNVLSVALSKRLRIVE